STCGREVAEELPYLARDRHGPFAVAARDPIGPTADVGKAGCGWHPVTFANPIAVPERGKETQAEASALRGRGALEFSLGHPTRRIPTGSDSPKKRARSASSSRTTSRTARTCEAGAQRRVSFFSTSARTASETSRARSPVTRVSWTAASAAAGSSSH